MDCGREKGGEMNFRRISEAYFKGPIENRIQSTIEYKSLSGTIIAPGATSQQTTFTLRGDGTVEYFRRGSFMERGGAFPGLWRAQCGKAELETVWDKLGELDSDSFPARVADPGDTISGLAVYFPDQVEVLTWGPPDHDIEAPGDAFLVALTPLMNMAIEGEVIWAVGMGFTTASRTPTGVSIALTFRNPGKMPIGMLSSKPGLRGGFTLRYALDRDAPPGGMALPVDWQYAKLNVPHTNTETLWNLIPGKAVLVTLTGDVQLEIGRRYIGKIQFDQIQHLDSIAGIPILSGSCFTDVFEFQA
jgi:hypothetical protein